MFNELLIEIVLGVIWGTGIGLFYRDRVNRRVVMYVVIGIWAFVNIVDFVVGGLTAREFIVNCFYVASMWATIELITSKYRQRYESLQRQAL